MNKILKTKYNKNCGFNLRNEKKLKGSEHICYISCVGSFWWTCCTKTLWPLSCPRAGAKSDCVSLNEPSMSAAEAPALKRSGDTRERGSTETVEGFYLYVTKSAPTVRQSGSGDGEEVWVWGRGLLAQWQGASMVVFLPFYVWTCTHTHKHTPIHKASPGDSPQE